MNRSLAVVFLSLGLAVGCGGSADTSSSAGGTGGGTGSTGTTGGAAGGSQLGPQVDKDLELSGDITMAETTTIAAGATLHLAAGAKLHAAKDAALIVKGKLEADGSADAPVVFESEAHGGPSGWVGLQVASGGDATLNHVEIHDATLAFQADDGSTFAIDYILVDTSGKIASLSSSGTLGHGKLHALGADQKGGPIVIDAASPKISDTLVDNANDGVDHIAVNGTSSSPQFDHVEVAGCHCAFHFNAGKSIAVSNSYLHDVQFGMMVVDASVVIDHSNFSKNATANIGVCQKGSAAAKDSYFSPPPKEAYGDGAFDASCSAQENNAPAAAALTDVGPRP